MKRFVWGLLLLISFPSFAEISLTPKQYGVLCADSEDLIRSMTQDFSEKMAWAAKESDGTIVSLWQNNNENTFTLIKTEKSGKVSCVISAGKVFMGV
jgi:hypothetical protein